MSQANGAAGSINIGTLLTNAELLVCSTTVIIPGRDSVLVLFWASVGIQPGTTSVNSTVRVRRGLGLITDPIVYTSGNINITAGNNTMTAITGNDTPLSLGPVVYSLTVQANGATANGNVNFANITALAFF